MRLAGSFLAWCYWRALLPVVRLGFTFGADGGNVEPWCWRALGMSGAVNRSAEFVKWRARR